MKKVIICCITLLCMSCGPWGDGYISRNWYVQNITEQALILKYPYSESLSPDDFEYREFEIAPMSSVLIGGGEMNIREETIDYDYYFIKSAQAFGEDVSWQIFSVDGVVLKTWAYSDKNISYQIFFDKIRWDLHQGGFLSTGGYWTFRINCEDILPTE